MLGFDALSTILMMCCMGFVVSLVFDCVLHGFIKLLVFDCLLHGFYRFVGI